VPDLLATAEELAASDGGYRVVHASPGLEVGVYVLMAPEPDGQEPHSDDELYAVLEGRGVLEVEGERISLQRGETEFVPARVPHRFVEYERLALLVVFTRPR